VEKSPDAFRTISEVADDLDVPQHVLRFWETRFREIKPLKRGGGRRYYRPVDVSLLRGIRHLLYGEGYTIRGVQRILREQGSSFVQNVWQPGAPQPSPSAVPIEPEPEDIVALEDAAALIEPELEEAEEEAAEAAPFEVAAGEPDDFEDMDDGADDDVLPESAAPALTAAPVAELAPAGMTADDLLKLQSALQDLTDCRRILDQALNPRD